MKMMHDKAVGDLNTAIRIHSGHMSNPKTDTPASEKREMAAMKGAKKALMKPMRHPGLMKMR